MKDLIPNSFISLFIFVTQQTGFAWRWALALAYFLKKIKSFRSI